MIANNGGPLRPDGGSGCGGTVAPVNFCPAQGPITFVGPVTQTVATSNGHFHVDLPPGTYQVSSHCGSTTVDVVAGKTANLDLWCQIP